MNRIPWWVFVSFAPLGLGCWTPFVPGVQLRRSLWIALGTLLTLATLAGWTLAGTTADDSSGNTFGGILIIIGWVGAIATTFAIRPAFQRASGSGFERDREAVAQRLHERREARELCERDPQLALELGVGRPDRPGARHAGLVDVNNASAAALRRLPGVDEALAQHIVSVREQLNGFSSLGDCGEALDLDGNEVERLREHVVFLPR